jgi:hypothetical protein
LRAGSAAAQRVLEECRSQRVCALHHLVAPGAAALRGQVPFDESGVERAREEGRVLEDGHQEVAVVADPADPQAAQRASQAARGFLARRPVRDQLGQQRVVVHAHDAALLHAAVHAHARQRLGLPEQEIAGPGQEVVLRIFGVEARFDGVPRDRERVLPEGQRLPGRHAQLECHEVEAGDEFGDRVLYLEPRVDLEEVKLSLGIEYELHRPRPDVAQRLG